MIRMTHTLTVDRIPQQLLLSARNGTEPKKSGMSWPLKDPAAKLMKGTSAFGI